MICTACNGAGGKEIWIAEWEETDYIECEACDGTGEISSQSTNQA